jgi:hypothetical protein
MPHCLLLPAAQIQSQATLCTGDSYRNLYKIRAGKQQDEFEFTDQNENRFCKRPLEYFQELSLKAFQQKDQYNGQRVFVTNGLKDKLDPDGTMNQTMIEFSNSIKKNLGDKISYKYLTYQNDGHVPFQSLYHGLKFVFESN